MENYLLVSSPMNDSWTVYKMQVDNYFPPLSPGPVAVTEVGGHCLSCSLQVPWSLVIVVLFP